MKSCKTCSKAYSYTIKAVKENLPVDEQGIAIGEYSQDSTFIECHCEDLEMDHFMKDMKSEYWHLKEEEYFQTVGEQCMCYEEGTPQTPVTG